MTRPLAIGLGIILAVIVIFGIGHQALANPACQKREIVVDHLASKYSEAPIAIGLANGGVVEVLTGPDSWTIIITMPNGTSCMIAAGADWQSVPKTPKENGT